MDVNQGGERMVLYFLGLAGCHFLNTYSGVRYSRTTKTIFSLAIFSCITCVIASLFFLALTGFHPQFNITTLWYALAFAFICLVSQYTGIAIYRYADIVGSGIVRSGASLLLNCLAGVVLFGESFSGFTAIRVMCLLGASALVLWQQKHAEIKKCTGIGWLISGVMVVNGIASNALSKSYATNPDVVDDNSYFLLVNLICLAVSLSVALIIQRGKISCCISELHTIRPKQFSYIVINTVSSNVTSLLIFAILSRGDIVLLTPLNSAIGFLISQGIAVFFEKEKLMLFPVLLALTATFISFLG